MSTRLYVGNLSYATTEATLRDLFRSVGEVVSVSIVTDRMTGQSRGFGFVEMATPQAAQDAISQLNGRMVDGRSIRVAEARPQETREPRRTPPGPTALLNPAPKPTQNRTTPPQVVRFLFILKVRNVPILTNPLLCLFFPSVL